MAVLVSLCLLPVRAQARHYVRAKDEDGEGVHLAEMMDDAHREMAT